MDLKQKFEEDKGFDVYAYRQEYAGASVNKDGFNDDYVEWLESKVKILSSSGVSQQRELLNAFQKHYQSDGYDDEMSFDWNISNFLKAFNCG